MQKFCEQKRNLEHYFYMQNKKEVVELKIMGSAGGKMNGIKKSTWTEIVIFYKP